MSLQQPPKLKRLPVRRPTSRAVVARSTSTRINEPMTKLERRVKALEENGADSRASKTKIASTIGRTLGNFVNQGDLGAMAGSSLAKLFGHGDYKIVSNSLMATTSNATGLKFSQDGQRGTRLREREFLGNVVSAPTFASASSTAFMNTVYPINPTNVFTFPWLSTIAPLFDQWEPHGIVFEFISTSSEYSSTSALGAVIMATDYDTYDPTYTSKIQMENSDYACSSKPSINLSHGCECDPRERPTPLLYTSSNNGAPITATTLGAFQLATQGQSSTGMTLGELWISYDITFYKKQLNPVTLPSTTPMFLSTSFPVGSDYWTNAGVIGTPRTITVSPNVINFNNIASGTKYLVVYYSTTWSPSNVGDNWTTTNGTLTQKVGAGPALTLTTAIVATVVTTTNPDTKLYASTCHTSAAFYTLSVIQVPADFTF